MNSHVPFTQFKNLSTPGSHYLILTPTISSSSSSSSLKQVSGTVIVLSFMGQFQCLGLRHSHPKKRLGQTVHRVGDASQEHLRSHPDDDDGVTPAAYVSPVGFHLAERSVVCLPLCPLRLRDYRTRHTILCK